MKARVYVSYKTTVLDPQGQTIQRALQGLGHASIAGVRQGKFFEIELAPGAAKEDAAREMQNLQSNLQSLKKEVSQARERTKALERETLMDSLTGIHNALVSPDATGEATCSREGPCLGSGRPGSP